jgi:hypothetical protein
LGTCEARSEAFAAEPGMEDERPEASIAGEARDQSVVLRSGS